MTSINQLSKQTERLKRQIGKMEQDTSRIIMTSEASINTAMIEVKVMKIGNRQVTLAVFRQLPDESVIDLDTGKLCGIPWGRVNYHVGCEDIGSEHMHIVWQRGDELCRSLVYYPWKIRLYDHRYQTFYKKFCRNFDWATIHEDSSKIGIEDMVKSVLYLTSTPYSELYFSREKQQDYLMAHNMNDVFEGIMELEPIVQAWQQSYKQLEQLDQLFIAV